jgi:hypothetical protein
VLSSYWVTGEAAVLESIPRVLTGKIVMQICENLIKHFAESHPVISSSSEHIERRRYPTALLLRGLHLLVAPVDYWLQATMLTQFVLHDAIQVMKYDAIGACHSLNLKIPTTAPDSLQSDTGAPLVSAGGAIAPFCYFRLLD